MKIINLKFNEDTITGWRRGIELFGRWFALESSLAKRPTEGPYLQRWICYLGVGTVRLHKFYRGDRADAFHDHPWWFVTFPLAPYRERILTERGTATRTVKAFRFHYRPAEFRHIVLHGVTRVLLTDISAEFKTVVAWESHDRPFYTFVISGSRSRGWGFWPIVDLKHFIPYAEFLKRVTTTN